MPGGYEECTIIRRVSGWSDKMFTADRLRHCGCCIIREEVPIKEFIDNEAEIKKLLSSGEIGEKLHTITFRNRAGDGWGADAYLARQPYFQTMPQFLIFEAGIHTIDTFRYLAGEIERVWCVHRKLNPVIAGEATAIGIFQFFCFDKFLRILNRICQSILISI